MFFSTSELTVNTSRQHLLDLHANCSHFWQRLVKREAEAYLSRYYYKQNPLQQTAMLAIQSPAIPA